MPELRCIADGEKKNPGIKINIFLLQCVYNCYGTCTWLSPLHQLCFELLGHQTISQYEEQRSLALEEDQAREIAGAGGATLKLWVNSPHSFFAKPLNTSENSGKILQNNENFIRIDLTWLNNHVFDSAGLQSWLRRGCSQLIFHILACVFVIRLWCIRWWGSGLSRLQILP